MKRRSILMAAASAVGVPGSVWSPTLFAAERDKLNFRRIPTQFIAALGRPDANSGTGAQTWGLWPLDPGPRGVKLSHYAQLMKSGGVAPDGWRFDHKDWWLEEHGLIMEQPTFPLAPLQYLVTGDRAVTTTLVIHPADKSGVSRWELGDKATLQDVTHLGCRAARYTPSAGLTAACSPANAPQTAFPVERGGAMPPVGGCSQQDYSVLIVRAVAMMA
ncbi:MAG: hypothetical protein ABIR55_11265 [Burkholderiaceae bacterium]